MTGLLSDVQKTELVLVTAAGTQVLAVATTSFELVQVTGQGPPGPIDFSHALRTDNPHDTTADQVGAYTTFQVDDLLEDKADVASLGNAASKNVGTTAGTVAAGNDSRITGALQATALLAAVEALLPAIPSVPDGLGPGHLYKSGDAAGGYVLTITGTNT